ncbi:MAG: hypothetical protein JW929_02205 [Anaerolineales bacterium]|nr:hypothetical protein [Anaerolineales bacterium]
MEKTSRRPKQAIRSSKGFFGVPARPAGLALRSFSLAFLPDGKGNQGNAADDDHPEELAPECSVDGFNARKANRFSAQDEDSAADA